jgi:ubiquinone biosynthesis protein UbiJ
MDKGEIEEIKRYFGVVAEGLRSEIRQVAEGHDAIREEIKQFREEVKEEFKEVKAMIKFSYAELDRRIRAIEDTVFSLQSRIERLEVKQN